MEKEGVIGFTYVYICETEKAVARIKMACINNSIKHMVIKKLKLVLTERMVPLRVCNDVTLGVICRVPIDKETLCGKKK